MEEHICIDSIDRYDKLWGPETMHPLVAVVDLNGLTATRGGRGDEARAAWRRVWTAPVVKREKQMDRPRSICFFLLKKMELCYVSRANDVLLQPENVSRALFCTPCRRLV